MVCGRIFSAEKKVEPENLSINEKSSIVLHFVPCGSTREFSAGRDTWFLGGVTDEQAREVDLPLDFLGEGSYQAITYADAPDADYLDNPQPYTITETSVTSSDTIHIHMAPGGGVAMSFKKICK